MAILKNMIFLLFNTTYCIQCCVQFSNGRVVLYTTVQCSDNAVSHCPMVQHCCSNCLMVGQCCVHCPIFAQNCVQLSNVRTVLCPTAQWWDTFFHLNMKFLQKHLIICRKITHFMSDSLGLKILLYWTV